MTGIFFDKESFAKKVYLVDPQKVWMPYKYKGYNEYKRGLVYWKSSMLI